MTMQGISNVLPKAETAVTEKTDKVKDTLFEAVMNNQGNKQKAKNTTDDLVADGSSDDSVSRKDLSLNRYQKSKSVDTKSDTTSSKDAMDTASINQMEDVDPEEAMTAIASRVMTILQELFGLNQDELQDIMESLNLQPQALVLSVGEDGIAAVDADALKQLVLGVHGMEDASAFLTNDTLNKQLQNVTETLTEFVSDMVSVSQDKFAGLEPEMMPELLKRAVDALQTADTKSEQIMEMTDEQGLLDATAAIALDGITENTSSSDFSKEAQQEMLMSGESETTQRADAEISTQNTMAETFVNRLSEALEKSTGMEEQKVTQTMDQIVEQVVRQVRIRVMPETTSMELRLNPASLGRVNLTVAASAGVATATMVVENQVAKEALESQMIQLKEAFSAQGLKVDAVEVTVAEFGLKKDGSEGQKQEEQNQSGNRKFHPDEGFSEEEVAGSMATSSERRDVNSTVDYTA